jgi:hypothetical protein
MASDGAGEPAAFDTPPAARPWIEALARLGYAAKGVVYLLVGWLTSQAARGLGNAPDGSRDTFLEVLHRPFGRTMLAVIAFGLFGYAVWRAVEAIFDPEGKGRDLKGLAVRAFYLGSAIVHCGLAVGAVRVISGAPAGGIGGDTVQQRTATAMSHPLGRWVVAGVGIALLIATGRQIFLAFGGYRKKLNVDRVPPPARRWVPTVVCMGHLARALVVAILGGFLVLAAVRHDPAAARGLAEALGTVEALPAGHWLLLLVAAGLAAYGIFQLLEARYRAIRP